MKLIHYSLDQFDGPIVDHEQKPGMKPRGLWVSVKGKDDWPSWCQAEEFRLDHLSHATEVKLRDDKSVLHIGTAAELDEFGSRYAESLLPRFPLHNDIVRWNEVAERYDGIIIAPYLWERRLCNNSFWYYGWDCASGCIWRAGAVIGLRPIRARRRVLRSQPDTVECGVRSEEPTDRLLLAAR